MSSLTSRERVRRALNHEETDRVPVDLGASRVSGIAAVAYRRLLERLGRSEDIRVFDVKQQLALPSLDMVNLLGGDVVGLPRLGPTSGMPFLRIDEWKSGALTDGTPCLVPAALETETDDQGTIHVVHNGERFAWRAPDTFYFNVTWAPLEPAKTRADIDAFQWSDPWTEREETFLRDRVQALYHGTDKAIFADISLLNGSFFEVSLLFFGFENFMMLLFEDPELVEYWLERKLAHDLEVLGRYLAVAGPYIDGIQLNDDFGTQTALQISPALYRRLFKPIQKKWIEFVKQRTRAKVFIHCDGAIEEILPDFIEVGIDVLNPVQTSARGMDAARLKQKYGRNLSFWGGGVDTQTTLPFGTIDDIRREVRDRMKILAPGGGYVFGTIHNIQPDIPPDKILAVFETAAECGAYPL